MTRPFAIAVEGVPEGHCGAISSVNSALGDAFEQVEDRADETVYLHRELGLRVTLSRRECGRAELRSLRVENVGERTRYLNRLSYRAFLPGDVSQPEKLTIHCFKNSWEGEFQYHRTTFFEEDIVKIAHHRISKCFSLESVGTYTTANYMPFLAVENEAGEALFFNLQPRGSWRIETGYGDSLYLDAAVIDLRDLGVQLALKPGETFCAPDLICGRTAGFAETPAALVAAKRRLYGAGPAPVVFNDYMNCLWARPSREKLLPLIEAAASCGAEVFCIDDGWQYELGDAARNSLGDWKPSRTLFGPGGLTGIFDEIRKRGMRPGLWFELEVCGSGAELYRKDDSWFLCRNGVRIGGGERSFLNFRNKAVTDYLYDTIARVYEMGVRYIKNDYNACPGNLGADLIEHTRAVLDFYRRIRADFPELTLENCASGAMRADDAFTGLFDLQSVSDQEIDLYLPSIVTGALCHIPAEKAGVWAYPYPHRFAEYFTGAPAKREYPESLVAFDMVTGLAGSLYLSGRPDLANEAARERIRQAVRVHRETRAFKAGALPYYPCGLARIQEKKDQVLLLRGEDGRRGLLYVWRTGEGAGDVFVPLSGVTRATLLYPFDLGAAAATSKSGLTVRLPGAPAAALFDLTFED